MITIKNTGADFEALSAHEYLVTNGIGGYAASSIIGANTRRYHGLLVAASPGAARRTVLVSKMEECITFNHACAYPFSSNLYPGAVHPRGFEQFRFFQRKPVPAIKFEVKGYHLLKRLCMVQGSNTSVLEYENTGNTPYKLRLSPQFVHRDYHALFQENSWFDFWMQAENGLYILYAHYGAEPLYLNFGTAEFLEERSWNKQLLYAREEERGLDFQEDCYGVGHWYVTLQPGDQYYVSFSTDAEMARQDPALLMRVERMRQEALLQGLAKKDSFLADLEWVAEQFVIAKPTPDAAGNIQAGVSLIAGYHWFTDWGRDTMIALRGLCIDTGKQAQARDILDTFFRYIDQGMLPNRFPDGTEAPEYNTIDATLWLFVALYEYYQKFQDLDFIAGHVDALKEILTWHLNGTRYDIHATRAGFLSGGEGLSQLSWMDARIGDHVVTPRHGCAVEIQALWYNALRIYQYFAGLLERPAAEFQIPADTLLQNFQACFQQADGSLCDVIQVKAGRWTPEMPLTGAAATQSILQKDPAIRPNQVYVLSLPFPLLPREAEARVLSVIQKQLLTDYGLRTLSPDHPDFKPKYAGDTWGRDTAYHQGTVWPFLLGEYISAYLKVNGWSAAAGKEALALLQALKGHFYKQNCLYGISEVFDGLQPNEGKGAVQQAWSVSALIRALNEIEKTQKKGRKSATFPFQEIKSMIF